MTKPNFKVMSKQELRAYVLAHRDDDEAFYAYADKIYEEEAAVESAFFAWLKTQNPEKEVIKTQDDPVKFIIIDAHGSKIWVELQLMMATLPTAIPFIENIIEQQIKLKLIDFKSAMMAFVSKNETDALDLERELVEADFNNRTNYSRVVGYVDSKGNFQTI